MARNDGVSTGAAQADVPAEGQAGGKRSRASSKDMVSSFEARLAKVEVTVGDLKDEFEEANVKELGEELRGELQGALNEAIHMLSERNNALEDMLEKTRRELEQVKEELKVCQAMIANRAISIQAAPRVDVPRPKEFKGDRSAREVDNFIWSMEQYFGALGIRDDATKVRTASMYLVDVAMLWWRRRCDEGKRGGRLITTWGAFVTEFRQQFFPEYAKDEARARLCQLNQKGTVRAYVKEFTELMLEILDMRRHVPFMDGLKPWVKLELKCRGV